MGRTAILGLLFLLLAGIGTACSCVQPGTPSTELNQSDAVFSGTVTDIRSTGQYSVAVRFDVTEVWAGPVTPTITVSTADNSAACGYPFEEDEQYLVYATGSAGTQYGVSLCSRTTQLSRAEADLAALGDGTRPAAPSPSPMSPRSLLLPLLFLAALLGIAAAVKRYTA